MRQRSVLRPKNHHVSATILLPVFLGAIRGMERTSARSAKAKDAKGSAETYLVPKAARNAPSSSGSRNIDWLSNIARWCHCSIVLPCCRYSWLVPAAVCVQPPQYCSHPTPAPRLARRLLPPNPTTRMWHRIAIFPLPHCTSSSYRCAREGQGSGP